MNFKIYVSLLIILSMLAGAGGMSMNFIASTSQAQEMFEIQDVDKNEGAMESKNHKIDSILAQISDTYMTNPAKATSIATQHEVFIQDNMVRVIFYLSDNKSENIKSLEEHGVRIKKTRENRVYAYVPIYQLKIIAELPFVNYIRRPWRSYPYVISEGIGVINADQLHDIDIRGDGVKVAILDAGFQGYQSKLGAELPGSVTVKSFRDDGDITGGGEVHGTACAEIVHDVAPNAQLYLVNYKYDDEFEDAVNWLISQNVDVISHSCGFPIGPFDGTGAICDAVNSAKAYGIVWANAAGNYAERHYEGTYRDTDGDDWHEFSTDGDQEMSLGYINAYEQMGIHLSWDDWPYSDQDYDLYIVNSNFEIVAGSENPQTGTQPPAEALVGYFTDSDYYYTIIHRYDATKNVHFELYSAFHDFSEHNVPSSSLAIPADAIGSLTVGATYWSDDALESFSSRGPTNDGRTKPDVTAPDGVSTSTYGTHGFPGTSASAPHVSGAAALLLSAFSDKNPDQIQDALEETAVDKGASGKDNLYGAGRIDVWEAYKKLNTTAPRTLSLSANPATVTPGVVSEIAARVTEDGSPVANISVDFETDFGLFTESRSNTCTVETNERGIAIAHFIADESGTATITATEPNGANDTTVVTVSTDGGLPKTGDMDGDSEISFDDVILLAKHYYFGDTVHADPDVNSDGSVTFDDVILLAKHYYFGDEIYP